MLTDPINTWIIPSKKRDTRYKLPPNPVYNEHPPYNVLNRFHKSYKNEDMFFGDFYDVFDSKVRIFIKSCISVGF
jgi:hypothetical protein